MNRSFVIITPCYNEQEYIKFALNSIIAQTVQPVKWLIVDDGSTDNTAKIIKNYAEKYSFIEYYYRKRSEGDAYYSSNVFAIMEGWEQVKGIDHEYLAILDIDITLPENYYQRIISEFEKTPMLGVASGIYENLIDGKLHPVLSDRRSTPKAIQLFRKDVFEQIGGYLPLKYGGEDTAACVMSRMHGWKVWSFPEIKVIHHRPTGTGNVSSLLRAKYMIGLSEYSIGSHWLFILIKCMKRSLKEEPYITGGIARFWGFIRGYFIREQRQVPVEMIKFFRKEQLKRIFTFNSIPQDHDLDRPYK